MRNKDRTYSRFFQIGHTFVVTAFIFAASAAAQDHAVQDSSQNQATTNSSSDRKFADEAACGGISEVKLGELAKAKGS